MVVVKIELWPCGDESKRQSLGVMHIINEGSGSRTEGNYDVVVFNKDGSMVLKTAKIRGFPRAVLGGWDLLHWALRKTSFHRGACWFELLAKFLARLLARADRRHH